MPSLYGLFFRQVIEGVVDFDRVKDLGVMCEPLALRQSGGIKQLFPMLVIPAGCADSNIAIRFAHGNILTPRINPEIDI